LGARQLRCRVGHGLYQRLQFRFARHSRRDPIEDLEPDRLAAQRGGSAFPYAGQFEVRRHARHQLAGGERFCQIVVGAGLQTLDPSFLAGPRRQENDRQIGQGWVGAQFAQQGKPVEPRHHHIGEHQIRLMAAHRIQRRRAVRHRLDIPTAAQQAADIAAHIGIVVGHDNAGASGARSERLVKSILGAIDGSVGGGLIGFRQPAQGLFDIGIGAQRGLGARVAAADAFARQMRPAERHRDNKFGAAAKRAVDRDRAAMQLHEFLHQRESDAGAFVRTAFLAFDAMEALEQQGQFVRRNADNRCRGPTTRRLLYHRPAAPRP
jgi:hypothetical protein